MKAWGELERVAAASSNQGRHISNIKENARRSRIRAQTALCSIPPMEKDITGQRLLSSSWLQASDPDTVVTDAYARSRRHGCKSPTLEVDVTDAYMTSNLKPDTVNYRV